jgi:hypothetical protein
MDIHQARTMSTQEDIKAKMDIHQEKMEAAMQSIRSELEETIKYQVEDVLLCVDQKTQGLHKGLRRLKNTGELTGYKEPGNQNKPKGALS